MLREMLRSKIHRATVTKVDLHYEGSLGVDEGLMDAAGILPYEAVHVWNVNNGQRLQTYAIPAPSGSGEVFLNGAAARLGQAGDLVIIATFCWLEDEAARQHHPRIILVDTANRISSTY
ncbi:MAG: aspartate 1-decarboxylase [Gammaproteobacteria bacterium]|nr:aspartate 1-decarboxylase [Gammaproteobacteria bacterium]